MKWLVNLESIAQNKQSGTCPFCNSENTDYAYNRVKNSDMGYGAVWCNECKRAFHISRIKITDESHVKEIPKDLIY